MTHELYDVTNFQIVGDYKIRVFFDDGSMQLIDFEPVLYGEMYGPLRDLSLFNQVRLDRETATLVWPNQADFDPWMLHEWPKIVQVLEATARGWELVPQV